MIFQKDCDVIYGNGKNFSEVKFQAVNFSQHHKNALRESLNLFKSDEIFEKLLEVAKICFEMWF